MGQRSALAKSIRLFSYLVDCWRSKSDPVGYACRLGVRMAGKVDIYGDSRTMFGSEPFLITLGRNVHICAGVQFLTHDGGVLAFRDRFPDLDLVAPIDVGNNVFIGVGAILLPGTVIGDDCVIGAGAVVTGSIPAGSVAAGNPARVVRSSKDYLNRALVNSLGVGHLSSAEKSKFYRTRRGASAIEQPSKGG